MYRFNRGKQFFLYIFQLFVAHMFGVFIPHVRRMEVTVCKLLILCSLSLRSINFLVLDVHVLFSLLGAPQLVRNSKFERTLFGYFNLQFAYFSLA